MPRGGRRAGAGRHTIDPSMRMRPYQIAIGVTSNFAAMVR